MSFDELDGRILNVIQTGFPVCRNPYDEIAAACDCTPEEAQSRIEGMRDAGDIRRIGAVFDSAHLGYVSTLCALAADDPDRVEDAAAVISGYPGVTHNYLRENRYNIWFTLIERSQQRIDEVLSEIRRKTGFNDVLDLPAHRLFKIRVDFDMTGTRAQKAQVPAASTAQGKPSPREIAQAAPEFSARDQALVRALQGNISTGAHPFDDAAEQLCQLGHDVSAAEVVERVQSWLADGTIRRFGAVVRHRKLGFTCNAMTVWDIPDESVEVAGAIMAQCPKVSHCYLRPRASTWPANVYGMIHGKTRDECQAAADDIRQRLIEQGIEVEEPMLLYSTREFKKRSRRYFDKED